MPKIKIASRASATPVNMAFSSARSFLSKIMCTGSTFAGYEVR